MKPGDTVEITPSQSTEWTTSGTDATAITLRNPNVTGAKWAAQILNGKASPVSYTVSAAASANPALPKATVLSVSAGDARNGTYRVYATNGLQYQLALDFNGGVYTSANQDGSAPVSDTFNTDNSEPGTYFFKSSRVASVANMSRFRMTTDAVVGAFPFIDPVAAGTVFAVRPFIGVRNLITSQAQLDGIYNRLGIQRTAATEASQIAQAEVSTGGTVFKLCNSLTIHSIVSCPPALLVTYTVTATETAGIWLFTSIANPADSGRFAIARIGDQNVYLSAGAAASTPGLHVWRLGVQDTPSWTSGTGRGGSTKGTWGTIDLTASGNTRTTINPDGTTAASANSFSGMGASGPAGMRQVSDGTGATYVASYNTKLFTIVGASNPSTGGYLQLNLID